MVDFYDLITQNLYYDRRNYKLLNKFLKVSYPEIVKTN